MTSLDISPRHLKKDILDFSVKFLAKKESSELTFRKIAKELGVQHNAVVYHFGKKENLLIAIAAIGFARFAKKLQKATSGNKSSKQKLENLGEAYLEFALKNPGHFRVMFGAFLCNLAPSDHELNKCSNSAQSALHQICHEVVIEVNQTILTASHQEELTKRLVIYCWSMMHGMALLFNDGPLSFHFQMDQKRYRKSSADILKMAINSIESIATNFSCL